jgi:beta-N-acetylhexosaminidase
LAAALSPEIMAAVQAADRVVVAVYASPTAGKRVLANGVIQNSVSLPGASGTLLHNLLNTAAAKTVVLAMGNPYLAKDFPEAQNYLCTYSAAPVSERSAAKALFGEIEIHGHLPVTIPNIAARGAGIVREAAK